MKRIILIFLAPLLLVSLLTTSTMAGGLTPHTALNNWDHFYLCDGTINWVPWTNLQPKPVTIQKMLLWAGVGTPGSIADFGLWMTRTSDGAILVSYNLDHYSNPTGPQQLWIDFAPYGVEIQSGESIAINTICRLSAFIAQPGSGGGDVYRQVHVVVIFYTLE